MKILNRLAKSFALAVLLAGPALAIPITQYDGFEIKSGRVGMKADKIQLRSSGGTGIFTLQPAASINSDRTITLPDPGANASYVMTEGTQTINGAKTFGGAVTHSSTLLQSGAATFTLAPILSSGTLSANGDTITIQDLGNANLVQSEGAQTINGAKTFGTPIGGASINTAVRRHPIVFNFKGGDVLSDGVTYVCSAPMIRAGTVKAITISAHTRMAGGTNTLALAKKQGGTSVTLLSTATVDPTAVPSAADTAQALTLTATGADLIFAAGDCLKATLVDGTMTTDGQGYALTIDVEYTDI